MRDRPDIRQVEQGAPPPEVRAGAAAYTPPLLAVYDLCVLHVASPLVWGCPAGELLRHYDANVSAEHLDVGVGTGFFLDRCRFPSPRPRLVLADLSRHSLAVAARRLRRHRPTAYRVNVLAPFALPERPFGSIGLGFLLHCLPGTFAEKGVVFDHLRPLLARGGVLFGATLLGHGVERTLVARAAAGLFNRARVFSNRGDSLAGLQLALSRRFARVQVRTVGCVALFSATASPSLG